MMCTAVMTELQQCQGHLSVYSVHGVSPLPPLLTQLTNTSDNNFDMADTGASAEPDLPGSTQLDAATAATLWQQYALPQRKRGIYLLSPAMTSDPRCIPSPGHLLCLRHMPLQQPTC